MSCTCQHDNRKTLILFELESNDSGVLLLTISLSQQSKEAQGLPAGYSFFVLVACVHVQLRSAPRCMVTLRPNIVLNA